jgi:hypothetical protein
MLRRNNFFQTTVFLSAAFAFTLLTVAAAQKTAPTTGGIHGHVRVDGGANPSDINVTVRQGDREVASTKTTAKGDFEVRGLAPGSYGLTLKKAGLQVGRMEGVEVRAGKTVSLKDHLFLAVDEGSIAHLRGSVFDEAGRSLRGAKVVIARLLPDGSLKKLDDRVVNSTGSFAFRLPPDAARYRLTAKADGMGASTTDVDIDGAAIYRVALTLVPAPK